VSYEIHPETPPEGVPLEKIFGPDARSHLEPLKRRCIELGLHFDPPSLLSNTRLAVEAAEFARDAGRHAEFHREALAAYFARGEDVGDAEVLARAAENVGLDPDALRTALASGVYVARRQAAEQEAHKLGITGVPTYVFADGARIVGAQPLEHFRRVLSVMAAAER
jgi:predicted DsbA family dithiol-disulfide isomerase